MLTYTFTMCTCELINKAIFISSTVESVQVIRLHNQINNILSVCVCVREVKEMGLPKKEDNNKLGSFKNVFRIFTKGKE